MDFVTKPVTRDILRHRLELHLKYAAYRTSLENQAKSLEDSIVVSFSNLVDRKDTNTGAHVIRTAQIARIIGEELLRRGTFPSLTAEDVNKTVRATPFHDIGKVGVSDLLLMKPGELTHDEYEKVKQHTTIGANLIRTIQKRTPALDYLSFAEIIAECHHEHWDGTGCPAGLKGDDIPLCARIVTVANEYDGCTTERAYRRAMAHPAARQYIFDGAGSRFDPRVVDAFGAVCEKCAEVSADDVTLLLNPIRKN
jgi:putative two-component system response regulator